MPSKKALTILIICAGIIISIWLFQSKRGLPSPQTNQNVLSAATTTRETIETNDDWKKILTQVDPNKETIKSLVKPASNEDIYAENTVTANVARDFFSQYLLAIKNGETITPSNAEKIAKNTLSSSGYTAIVGPIYIRTNLKINPENTKENKEKYKNALNLSLKTRSEALKNNPITIIQAGITKDSEKELAQLDPIIAIGRGFISDFLQIEVPEEAVSLHLALLNSMSQVLADVEAMRVILQDPIRGFVGTSQYNFHMLEFQKALANINTYFSQKI